MTNYLIEFRFSGYAKEAIMELKNTISRNFHVTRKKIVPHISLVGSLYTNDEKKLVKEISNVAKHYDIIKFKLDGFDRFENRVIYVKIVPSEELKQLRLDLVEKLRPFCKLSEYDYDQDFTFHATIVLHDIERKFDKISEFLKTWKIPEIELTVLRITVIGRNSRILCEYDLMQKKVLNRSESLDRDVFKKTIKIFNEKRDPSEIKFEEIPSNEQVFVLSDTHFDHSNVIRFTHRPFSSVLEMNHELVSNWNKAVKDNRVYFLGDLAFGRGRRPIDHWLEKLGGKIYLLRGNHDTDIIRRASVIPNRYGIQYGNYKFLLMHEPRRPFGYDGWIIHGDKHNINLIKYPFINQNNKTINVSSELVNYTPISLEKIILLIDTGRSYITTEG